MTGVVQMLNDLEGLKYIVIGVCAVLALIVAVVLEWFRQRAGIEEKS